MHTRDGKPRIGGGGRGKGKKVSDFASGLTTNDPTSIHITRGRECRQLLPSSSALSSFPNSGLFPILVSVFGSRYDLPRGVGTWGEMGRRVIVRLENQCRLARSTVPPPPAWHPRQVGYVSINNQHPPTPSIRPGPKRRRERDRREEEVSCERYLSLGDLLGGEGQPRGRLACQFRQQSFLPLPLPLNNGTGHSQGTSFCSPPSAYLIYKKAFLELAVVSVAKKEAFPFFLFGGAFSRLGNLI